MARTFESKPAVLSELFLRIAIAGPTGSGKSLSGHILAHAISRVTKKDVYVVNTEGPSKGLMYAPRPGAAPSPPTSFPFQNVPLKAPYGSLDYLAAIQWCAQQGAGVIVVDQWSFEHEGEGGYLDLHEKELDRMAGKEASAKERARYWGAWVRPGAERHAMLMGLDQIPAHVIGLFRAKEKIKILKGQKEPIDMGWQAIAGDEVLAEFPIRLLLPEGADGVPNLSPQMPGEKLFNRIPIHLRNGFFTPGQPINSGLGEKLARWAAGGAPRIDDPPQDKATPLPDERSALLDQILAVLKESFPGKSDADKIGRSVLLNQCFGEPTWKGVVDNLQVDALRAGLAKMQPTPREREPGEDDE